MSDTIDSFNELIKQYEADLLRRTGHPTGSPGLKDAVEILKSDASHLKSKVLRFAVTKVPDPNAPSKTFAFPPLLGEALLQEASLLVDRCLSNIKDYQELIAKSFEARIQVLELVQLSEIAAREEKEIYGTPHEIAIIEREAQDALSKAADQARLALNEGLQASDDGKRVSLADHAVKASFGQGQKSGWAGGATKITWPDYNKKEPWIVADQMAFFAEAQTNATLQISHSNLESQRRSLVGQRDSATEMFRSLDKAAALKDSQAKFQKERNAVARLIALRRADALTTPGGELNYEERIKPLYERFIRDSSAAWNRAIASAKGIFELYGYQSDIPLSAPDNTADFNLFVSWLQDTNLWIASLQANQEAFVRSVSLRKLLGDSAFESGLKKLKWEHSLDSTSFYNKKLLRLRAIAAQIVSPDEGCDWNVVAVPPSTGHVVNPDGTASKEFDQSHIGELHLGMVGSRSFTTFPDFHSPLKLFNASPLGRWEFRLDEQTARHTTGNLRDVIFYFKLASNDALPAA